MADTIDIVYQGSLRCLTTWGNGGITLITDVSLEHGGLGESFSPTDLVASALGTCLMGVLGVVGERNGLDLLGTRIRVTKEMRDKPRRIASLRATVTFPDGRVIPPEIREKFQRALDHCPVKQSLHPDVRVSVEMEYPEG
jgi:putative redox protein